MKLLFAIVLITIGSQALADSKPAVGGARQAVVHYDDLNLRNPAGAALLRRRIDHTIIALSAAANPLVSRANADLAEARARGRTQADCLVAAANSNTGIARAAS